MSRLRIETAPQITVYDESAVFKASTGSTAPLIEFKDSGGNTVANVSSNGSINVASITATSISVNGSATVTLNGAETLTNKTLTDSTTFFQDQTDNTKKLQFELSGITTSTTRTLTVPNSSGTLALTSDKLSTFGSTTSAELAGVISDETGTGNLVFSNSPVINVSITTASSSIDLFTTTATTVNFANAATTFNIAGAGTTVNIANTATAAQTVNLGAASTGASTYNIGTGTTAASNTKTLNIGTGRSSIIYN